MPDPWFFISFVDQTGEDAIKAFQDVSDPADLNHWWHVDDAATGVTRTYGYAKSQAEVRLQDFDHGGKKVRGISSVLDIKANRLLFAIPSRLRLTPNGLGDARFLGTDIDDIKQGLWFAEKKAELVDRPLPSNATPEMKFWRKYFGILPTLQEFRVQGVPLAAPEDDIQRLRYLPQVSQIVSHVDTYKARIQEAVAKYNAFVTSSGAPGSHSKITSEDALWGTIVFGTRAFSPCGSEEATLAPVMDMLNHSPEPFSNVEFACDWDRGLVSFFTTKRVPAGTELTSSYWHASPTDTLKFLRQYGIFGVTRRTPWPDGDCQLLRRAHLEEGDGALIRMVRNLVDLNCRGPATTAGEEVNIMRPKLLENKTTQLEQHQPTLQYPSTLERAVPSAIVTLFAAADFIGGESLSRSC